MTHHRTRKKRVSLLCSTRQILGLAWYIARQETLKVTKLGLDEVISSPAGPLGRLGRTLETIFRLGQSNFDNGNHSQMPRSPGHAACVCGFTAFDVHTHCLQHHLFFPRGRRPRVPAHRSGTQASGDWFCQAPCRYALPRSGELRWGTLRRFSRSPGSLSQRKMSFTGGGGSTCSCPSQVRGSNAGNQDRTICCHFSHNTIIGGASLVA